MVLYSATGQDHFRPTALSVSYLCMHYLSFPHKLLDSRYFHGLLTKSAVDLVTREGGHACTCVSHGTITDKKVNLNPLKVNPNTSYCRKTHRLHIERKVGRGIT